MSVNEQQERLETNLGRIYGQREKELLGSILSAFALALDTAHGDVDRALAQLVMTRSFKHWLDLWGELFNIARRTSTEVDIVYAARIIEETLRQRPQPQALELIVLKTLGVTIFIKNLWPLVLHSNQWSTPAGRPPQVCDGHLEVGWVPGSYEDNVVRCGFEFPYRECVFGVWVDGALNESFSYTLENIRALLPLVLFSDAHLDPTLDETLHVCDRHLTDLSTARYSFGVSTQVIPSSVQDILNLIERHRAAGTEAVFMGFKTL